MFTDSQKTFAVALINDHFYYNDVAQKDCSGMEGGYKVYIPVSEILVNMVSDGSKISVAAVKSFETVGMSEDILPHEIELIVARVEQILDNIKELE